MKSRRGLSTVVGIVFFIIVFAGVATYVTYSMNQLDKFGQTIIEKGQEDRNRDREQFEIAAVSRDNNKFNITIQNTGELPFNITRLWIQNKTDPSWGTQKFDISESVSPGQTLIKVGQDLQLAALDTQGYGIRLVTERGNAKEFFVNSVSQEPVYLQLFVLPSNVPSGFNTTLLFAVTNNMSNNGALTNFVPQLVVTPQGASYNLMSGPEPAIYPLLKNGDTAYFQWIYKISGIAGQGVKFEASLDNGYLENSVSRKVAVIASSSTKDASAYHRTGGTVWYNSGTYSSSAPVTQSISANTTQAFPFIVGTGFTIDVIEFEVLTPITGQCMVAIYDTGTNLYPNNRLAQGTDQSTSGAAGTRTDPISVTLSDNTLYWLAINCKTSVQLRALPVTAIPNILGNTGTASGSSNNVGWTVTGAHGLSGFNMPNPYPVGATLIANTPPTLINVRAQ